MGMSEGKKSIFHLAKKCSRKPPRDPPQLSTSLLLPHGQNSRDATVIMKSEHPVIKILVSGKLWIDIATEDLDDAPNLMKGRPCCNYHEK
jgi:hypothetical protein